MQTEFIYINYYYYYERVVLLEKPRVFCEVGMDEVHVSNFIFEFPRIKVYNI